MREERNTNNDLISREALKETIDSITWYHINPYGELVEGAFDDDGALYKAEDIYNAVDNASTVDVKDEIAGAYNEGYMCGNKEAEKARPQGEWIANPNGDYVCNKCSWVVGKFERNFCPNCGADMRKCGAE